MKIQPKNKKQLLKAALGEIPCDLVITNVQLVNVITGEIYPADIFVYDGFIAHVEYQNVGSQLDTAREVVDGQGRYLIPGLIDAHEHIESSMMTPRNFAKGVIPHGTTTVVTDPHEIANVCGLEGVRYMHQAGDDLPMRQPDRYSQLCSGGPRSGKCRRRVLCRGSGRAVRAGPGDRPGGGDGFSGGNPRGGPDDGHH
ncbi:MAG: amidohydrolase family protein [Lachnospiraceae bacterium]